MNIIRILMVIFSMLGAADILIGYRFGLGKQFEKGIMLTGTMVLTMAGMLVIAPVIANVLRPVFEGFYQIFRIDPSVIPAMLFANDMGGASIATEIAIDPQVGRFNALVVSSMLGATISFSLPFAMKAVNPEHHDDLMLGFLCGVLSIPAGCLVAGILCGIPILVLLYNMLPLILISVIIAVGIVFFRKQSIFLFKLLASGMKLLITAGLALSLLTFLTGYKVIDGMGKFEDAAMICLNAAAVMSGAFPLIFCISKLLRKPLERVGNRLNINSDSAMGFVSSLATNVTTFEMMNSMDRRGIVLNGAFAVSAAFTFAGHLAFTMAFDESCLVPMIVGKLVAGVAALLISGLVLHINKSKLV